MTDMGEHRVPLLGSAWRRNEDPAASRDPRVRAVVGALASLPGPEMRTEFRADLRAQLVAITPRIVAESSEGGAGTVDGGRLVDIVPSRSAGARPRPTPRGRASAPSAGSPRTNAAARHGDGFLGRLHGVRLGRPLAVAASVLVAFAVLLGGAVVMSKKALPGDALYGLKRASERVELATAGSAVDEAKDHLDFATTRAQEARDLLSRAGGSALGGTHAAGSSSETADLVRSALQSADGDVRAAARLLGTDAVRHSSAAPLATMTAWAPAQAARLQAIADATNNPAVRGQAESSLRLVRAAQGRAGALAAKVGCACLTNRASDSLGPVPCTTCAQPVNPGRSAVPATPAPAAPRKSTAHKPAGTSNTGAVTGGTGRATPAAPAAPGGATSSSPSPSKTPLLPIQLPTSSAPIQITPSSCGVSVTLPIVGGVGVGLCNGVNLNVGK
jgi:hypothetical protein